MAWKTIDIPPSAVENTKLREYPSFFAQYFKKENIHFKKQTLNKKTTYWKNIITYKYYIIMLQE